MSKTIVASLPDSVLTYGPTVSDRFSFSRQFVPRALPDIPFYRDADLTSALGDVLLAADVSAANAREIAAAMKDLRLPLDLLTGANFDDARALINLFKSELGYLFYDRTRVRPTAFRIGEHLYSLSLAPGEEVTIEQKSWTKREISLEELLERETTLDLEIQSTFATELQESLDSVKKLEMGANGTLGGNVDILSMLMAAAGAGAGAPAPATGGGAGPIGVNTSIQPSIKYSDEVTKKESTKNTFQQTNKLAAKYRSLHKTTYKVTTEVGTESTSRRTIRNPNRTTPINLHYFKILREHELTQERYAVRLCWSPWVRDPGAHVRGAGGAGTTGLPPKPQPPTLREPKMSEWSAGSPIHDQFDAAGSMSFDSDKVGPGVNFAQSIEIPNDWKWDEDQNKVELRLDFAGQRSHHIEKSGDARVQEVVNGLPGFENHLSWDVTQHYHVGIDCTKSTFAGGVLNRRDPTRCTVDEPVFQSGTKVHMRAGLKPDPTAEERAAIARYNQDLDLWNRLAAMQPQTAPAADAQTGPPSGYNPLSELMRALVESFGSENTDDYWEVEYWHRLFDWENASYVLYPGWWSGSPLPYPGLPATNFLNASWAKLFIPVQPGYEHSAMRWIIGRRIDLPLNERWETEIDTIKQELEDYREENFGDPQEYLTQVGTGDDVTAKFTVLGRWTDLLPTDGTHVEVVQSMTTAADAITATEFVQAEQMRAAAIEGRQNSANLKQKAGDLLQEPVSVALNIDDTGA